MLCSTCMNSVSRSANIRENIFGVNGRFDVYPRFLSCSTKVFSICLAFGGRGNFVRKHERSANIKNWG